MRLPRMPLLTAAGCVGLLSLLGPAAPAGVYPDTPDRLWPGGVVPYAFTAAVNANQRCNVLAAMQVWESVADVQFVPRTDEDDYMRVSNVQSGPRWVPAPGYTAGSGVHELTLNDWCDGCDCSNLSPQQTFGIVHELGHALGLFHSHQRTDRDNYYDIDPNLISSGAGNYTVANSSDHWPRFVADVDSIMSYPLCINSVCDDCAADLAGCAPIQLLPPYDAQWAGSEFCPSPQAAGDRCVGQRNHISRFDTLLMSFLYPPSNWTFVDQYDVGPGDGTFHDRFTSFQHGFDTAPAGGTLWIVEGGTYAAPDVLSKSQLLRAAQGALLRN